MLLRESEPNEQQCNQVWHMFKGGVIMMEYNIEETSSPASFRKLLRNSYKAFEEQRKNQKEDERRKISDIEKELQKKFDELFGDDDE